MKYTLISSIFLILALMICCEDENLKPKKYPYVITLPVAELDSTGVTFKARILDYGQQPITDFGFILIDNSDETRYSLMNITTPEEFKLRMFSDIDKNKIYSARAYVKTEAFEVLGNLISFKGLGSVSPEINTFSPDSGMDGTIVTITGNYFNTNKDKNYVRIGETNAEVLTATNTELVIKTPSVNYYGSYKISVTINDRTCISEKEYTILGPRVYSVNPEDAKPGEIVTINGIRLIDDILGVQVYFNEIAAEIITANADQLAVRVPPYPVNFTYIRLISGKKVLDIPYVVNISQSYVQLNTAGFTDQNPLPAFSTGSRGFVFDYDKIWEFVPVSNSWSIVGQYPGQSRHNMFFFTIGNKAYMGGGSDWDYNFEFWEYDTDLNNWKQLKDVPAYASGSCGFALNGKGYLLGADPGHQIISFWQYNPGNNTWIQMPDVPPGEYYNMWGYASFFVLNNKPYVKIKGVQNNFFEYSETNGTWTKRADCPLEFEGFTFSINNKGYIGSTFWGQLFEYNPENGLWIQKLPYPGCNSLGYYFGFAINNTGYMGVNESSHHDCQATFYRFTP